MSQENTYRIPKFDYLMLLPILALAFYLAFIPHHNYPYLVHLDEWLHLAFSEAILQAGSTTFVDPFLGQSTTTLLSNPESGYHLFWAVFYQISGISWLDIFKYFPAIIFVLIVLSVYVLARRQGFGWQAAFFTCLIPTTVGILGPGFLVPVAMGLLFIALSIFVAFNFKTPWSYLVLFIFTAFLLSMHAVTAAGLVIILVPYILLNLKDNFKHSLGITLALVLPILLSLPATLGMVVTAVESLFVPQPLLTFVDLPRIIQTYGYLPILFCLVGTFLLAMKGGKKNYGLVFGLLASLVVLVVFYRLHYGVIALYYRGLQYMMLMTAIVAGAGLMWVESLRLPVKIATRLKVPFITQNAGYILCLVLVGLTLFMSIPSRQNTPYYHMIDDEDYQAFIWIKENISEDYERAILDPWKGVAFAAITGKYVYTYIGEYPKPSDNQAYEFLRDGSRDTAFLKENGISIIYTRGSCDNTDLVEVRKYVYILRKAEESE